MTKNGTTITWRVGELEKRVDHIDKSLDTILQNHLPHLHEEVAGIRTSLKIVTGVVIASFLSLIGLILEHILK